MPSNETNEVKKTVLGFKMGCDPEFCVNAGNRCLDAKEFFVNTFGARMSEREIRECRDNEMGFNVGRNGNIGWDGCSSTGEMRPSAENTIEGITNNIKNILVEVAKKTNIVSLKSLSLQIPMGGHIHLELPFKQPEEGEDETNEELTKQENFCKKAIKILATMWIPLMLGESKININGRIRHGYGEITDKRVERHGNAKTLEFRCPTAEWLTTRKVCEGTLKYMACVWNEIIKNGEGLKKSKNIIFSSGSQATSVQRMLLIDYGAINDSLVKSIANAIKNFELYNEFKEDIDYILNYKKVIKDKNECGFDIFTGWNIKGEEKKVTSSDFTGRKKFLTLAKKTNLDILGSMAPVQYNGDREVDNYANELCKRIVAFNMNVKNEIVLFGLRKGIKDIIAFNDNKELIVGKKSSIKSKKDALVITNEIMNKLLTKYSSIGKTRQITRYEWRHSRKKGDTNKIFIGIPYDMRTSGKMKEFLKVTYRILTGKLKGEKIENIINNLPETAKDGVDAIEEMDKDQKLLEMTGDNKNAARRSPIDATDGLYPNDDDNEEENNWSNATNGSYSDVIIGYR